MTSFDLSIITPQRLPLILILDDPLSTHRSIHFASLHGFEKKRVIFDCFSPSAHFATLLALASGASSHVLDWLHFVGG